MNGLRTVGQQVVPVNRRSIPAVLKLDGRELIAFNTGSNC
jgi:hypothetical protein